MERHPCIIIGCRRTFRPEPDDVGHVVEVICGKHYRLTDARIRALRTKIKRKVKRIGWTDRLNALDWRLWERCKLQATERSFGL